MAKFKAVPQPRSEKEFVEEAETSRVALAPPTSEVAVEVVSEAGESSLPWDGLDPKGPPMVNQTVRLNAYQHAKLRYLAELEDRSQAQILRRLLGPALDAATSG